MSAALTLAAVLLFAVFVGLLVVDHCLQADPDDEGADHA
jgi:hypothetical protein